MAKKYNFVKSFTFDGKRYYIRGDTEREVLEKMALKKRALEEGKVIISSNMTVEDWAYRAVEIYKTRQKEVTKKKYISKMKHCVLEQIGYMPLKSVKPVHCQEVLNLLSGKSAAYIDDIYQIIQFIFKKAEQNKLISSNPSEYLTKPLGTKTKRRSITDFERYHFLKVTATEPRFKLFLLMYYCGCRPSEAIEAQGRDITTLDGHNVLYIRGTKSNTAERLVPIPDALYDIIKTTPKMDYISPNMANHKHNEKSYQRVGDYLKRQINISMGCRIYRNQLIPPYPLADDFVPYNLRHTFCADLQKKGVDIRTAQYLMGHSDISLTANIYTHADQSTIVDAAKTINGSHLGSHLIP